MLQHGYNEDLLPQSPRGMIEQSAVDVYNLPPFQGSTLTCFQIPEVNFGPVFLLLCETKGILNL